MTFYEKLGHLMKIEPGMRQVYHSAFGPFEIPREVLHRAMRYETLRPDYLDKWCEFQWSKTAR